MSWSKLKQQLEEFLSPTLSERVKYSATSYRYLPDKSGTCYLVVDKKNILNLNDTVSAIKWYQTEQDVKSDPDLQIPISNEEIEVIRKDMNNSVPEDRLIVIAKGRKLSKLAKDLLLAQSVLSKSNFTAVATKFLSTSIEDSLESDHILLNVLALIDRRVGKKRIQNMADTIKLKHPIIQYFYELRLGKL
jgi:hypothetical protein